MSGTLSLDADGTLPVLEGWMTLPRAGEVLGITRQSAYKMAKKKKFKTLHLVEGTSIVLVRTEEVEALSVVRAVDQALVRAANRAASENN